MRNDDWKGIYGQDTVKSLLNSLIESDKIPNAFLFKGNDGTGKEITAIRFAQALITRHIDSDSNEHIRYFIQNFSEPYIKYIFPLPRGKNETESSGPLEKLTQEENELVKEELKEKANNLYYNVKIPKANQIKISSIRDIKKFLSIDYGEIKFRFVLISKAHLMNEEAQNAVLKNLEEPPDGTVFILFTPYPSLLRETIRSRCWLINFQPLKTEDIENILISEFKIDPDLAKLVSPFSNGSITEALNLLQHDFALLKEKTILILRNAFGKKFDSAFEQFHSVLDEQGSDSLKILILMIISWLNDLQKYRAGLNNFFFEDYKETFQKFNLKFSDLKLNTIVYKLDKCATSIQNNININILSLNIITELSLLTTNKS